MTATNFPEAVKFALLWATKDAEQVRESKVFWVLMEMSINMAINCKPRLSQNVFEQLSGYVEFKVEFHCISIRARKDLEQKWHDLPYLATDDAIAVVLDHWPAEWRMASDFSVGSSTSTRKKKKEDARSKM